MDTRDGGHGELMKLNNINAVRTTPFSDPILWDGVDVEVIDPDTIYPELGTDSTQRHDIHRFHYFYLEYQLPSTN